MQQHLPFPYQEHMRLRPAIAMALAVCSAAGMAPMSARQDSPAVELAGLWRGEAAFGPQVSGTLVLERVDDGWTMRIGGFDVNVAHTGREVRCALPDDQGEFRGSLGDDGQVVRGFWIQPSGNMGRFATPVTLHRAGPKAWRGQVAPLPDALSLYLAIRRDTDGSLRGVFRNPEMNWTGRAPWFRVVPGSDTISLVDPVSGKARFVQPYDAEQRRITFDFGAPVVLTPTASDTAVGYLPRVPANASYRYRMPVADADGWEVARAADVGLDEAALAAFVRHILSVDPSGDGAPRIHSLLVARHGRLVIEEYFFGFSAERLHDLRSASKTFTSVMAGAAMDAGAPFTMTTPVSTLFADRVGASPDPRAARITVGQLLTHTSGLACDDNDESSPGHEDTMQRQRAERDWHRFALALPVIHDPGTRYAYCSAGVNLVGGVIARTTGTSLTEFFDARIARPMQIERYAMNLMPSGDAYAAGGMYLRPRDFLKFGQVYLDEGEWRGRHIVSRAWVARSTARQVDAPNGSADGFGWHRYRLQAGALAYDEYEASGNGGQFLVVVPDLDLAVVVTAGNYNEYAVWRTIRDDLIPRFVLGAVKARQ